MAENNPSQNDLIEEFCKITGVSAEQSEVFLKSTDWNLDLAVTSYYEEYEDIADSHIQPPSAPIADLAPPPVPTGSSTRKIATLSNLLNSKDDEEDGQAFYAGGSERSGQQLLGPSKKKKYPEIVEEMFNAAKGHGAQVIDPSDSEERIATGGRGNLFQGMGHRLGSNTDESPPVPIATLGSSSSSGANAQQEFTLKLWQNGFSIDDEPLRDYSDTQNQDFLNSIRHGEIPRELVRKAKGSEVHLNMEDHRHEAYAPPKVSLKPFVGTGHRLGSPMPTVVQEKTTSKEDEKTFEEEARKNLNVQSENPTTNIQIRLPDGSRIIIKCNHTHTLADIKQYLVTARPEYATLLFELMTMYPNKELTEDSQTVKDLNLLNAGLVLKLK